MHLQSIPLPLMTSGFQWKETPGGHSHITEKPEWIIWLIWAIVGQYTDKMTQRCVKMSLFVRVVTHYGSNESNDSLGVFSEL